MVYDDGTPRTKHVTTNLAIDVDEEAGTAVSRSYFTVLQALPDMALQPIVSGRYYDRFERHEGQWRFVERRVQTDLVGDVSRHLRRSPRPEASPDSNPRSRHSTRWATVRGVFAHRLSIRRRASWRSSARHVQSVASEMLAGCSPGSGAVGCARGGRQGSKPVAERDPQCRRRGNHRQRRRETSSDVGEW